jgi:hypothetical protein
LELPVRPAAAGDGDPPAFGPPVSAPALETEVLSQVDAYHLIEHDIVAGTYVLRENQDGDNRVRHLADGVEMWDESRDEMSIREGDPLSARTLVERTYGLRWDDPGVEAEIRTRSELTCDATTFFLEDRLEAFEDGEPVFERTWSRSFPRDHV